MKRKIKENLTGSDFDKGKLPLSFLLVESTCRKIKENLTGSDFDKGKLPLSFLLVESTCTLFTEK